MILNNAGALMKDHFSGRQPPAVYVNFLLIIPLTPEKQQVIPNFYSKLSLHS